MVRLALAFFVSLPLAACGGDAPTKPAPTPSVAAPTGATPEAGERRYADSPGDGFLALRSEASVSSGSRVAQIPHGAPVAIGACDGPAATISGRSGQWCRATYDGQSGYVFDAFLATSQPAPRAAPQAREVTPGPVQEGESAYEVTGTDALSFRSSPSIGAARVGTVPRGGTFNTLRCEVNARTEGGKSRTWCYAESGDGLAGWVSIRNEFATLVAG